MYILVAGGGKVGANFARTLLKDGKHEVTLIEQRRDRFIRLEREFEHQIQLGDATEIFVLERAGIARPPDIVAALTGDDEDNLIISPVHPSGGNAVDARDQNFIHCEILKYVKVWKT